MTAQSNSQEEQHPLMELDPLTGLVRVAGAEEALRFADLMAAAVRAAGRAPHYTKAEKEAVESALMMADLYMAHRQEMTDASTNA